MIAMIKYGWTTKSGNVYMRKHGLSWSTTKNLNEATKFKSVDHCIIHWLTIHCISNIEKECYRNNLIFIDEKKQFEIL